MKRPGYSVRITCFIEASPTDMDQMRLAISAIDAACEALRQDGFQMVKHETRFMLSREVGEEKPPAEGHDPVGLYHADGPKPIMPGIEQPLLPGGGPGQPPPIINRPQQPPPIPAALDRRKA
jgi:hypothetical protein